MTEFVERPDIRATARIYDYIGLVETANNGKAIAIPLNGRQAHYIRTVLSTWLGKRGYRLHYRKSKDKKNMICWTEPWNNKENHDVNG